MTKTFKDLLELPIEEVHHDIEWLSGCYYNHLHMGHKPNDLLEGDAEFYIQHLKRKEEYQWMNNQDRISFHVIKHFSYDGRRIWSLFVIKFDSKLAMVCKNAGREGDDHWGNVILDPEVYRDMHLYVTGNYPVIYREYVRKLDDDATDFLDFYNQSYFDKFEVHE